MLLLTPPARDGDDEDSHTRAVIDECARVLLLMNDECVGVEEADVVLRVDPNEETARLMKSLAMALLDGDSVLVIASMQGFADAYKKRLHLGSGDTKRPLIVNVCKEPREAAMICEFVARVYEPERNPMSFSGDVVSVHQCQCCDVRSPVMQRCKGCKLVWYCNETCQKEDWATHREFCRLHATAEEGDSSVVRFVDSMLKSE